MGYTYSKLTNNNYLQTLPPELRNKLCSYLNNISDISQLLQLDILRENIYNSVTMIKNDCNVSMDIDTFFRFKSLECCEIPILITSLSILEQLIEHETIKKFNLVIPNYVLRTDCYYFSCQLIILFSHFIKKYGSIKDMDIVIKITSYSPSTYILSFLNYTIKTDRYLKYQHGILSVDEILAILPFHSRLLTLLNESNNLIEYRLV